MNKPLSDIAVIHEPDVVSIDRELPTIYVDKETYDYIKNHASSTLAKKKLPLWYRAGKWALSSIGVYASLAILHGITCNSIDSTIVPGRAYKLEARYSNNVFNIFSTDSVRYETTRNFDGDSPQNRDCLEINKNGAKTIIVANNTKRLVDTIQYGDGESATGLSRILDLETHKTEFEEAQRMLKEVSERYADWVEDVRNKAVLGR